MKKTLSVFAFAIVTLSANAQFTTYQSVNPNVSQQQGTQRNSGAPFTTYQSINKRIRQNSTIRPRNVNSPQQPQRIVKGVYLNAISNEAQYIKMKIADYDTKQYAKAYYDAETDQWFQCNSEVKVLGIYDDAELREYFTYKVSIPNIGTIYY